ncbi:MAG: hypothetical protein KA311_00160 [Sediminibacterium sp.]|jgi:hypothetical protein|nr:hypothetical protein [Sediminibacterium sp.]MBP7939497.1 hypothetical protein [Sediminibacterium sp.]
MTEQKFKAIYPDVKEIKTSKISKIPEFNKTITLYNNGFYKRDWINQNDEGYISDSPAEQWMHTHIFN